MGEERAGRSAGVGGIWRQGARVCVREGGNHPSFMLPQGLVVVSSAAAPSTKEPSGMTHQVSAIDSSVMNK